MILYGYILVTTVCGTPTVSGTLVKKQCSRKAMTVIERLFINYKYLLSINIFIKAIFFGQLYLEICLIDLHNFFSKRKLFCVSSVASSNAKIVKN